MTQYTHQAFAQIPAHSLKEAQHFVDIMWSAFHKEPDAVVERLDTGVQDYPAGECCYIEEEDGDRMRVYREKTQRYETWIRKG